MSAFTDARLQEFRELLSLYGTTFTFNGKTFRCISPPRVKTKEMKRDNYQEEIPAEFTLTALDYIGGVDPYTNTGPGFNNSGIVIHSYIIANGITFDVDDIITDDVEPTVILRAVRKQ